MERITTLIQMVRCYIKKILFIICAFVFLNTSLVFARAYTFCTGKEFNTRVKNFLNGNDANATMDFTVTIFERGKNPPVDRAYYVDVSEDKDESIIVYTVNKTLYWYSDGAAIANENCAYMFEKFMALRNIDMTDIVFLNSLNDTRYMFSECRNLKTLSIRSKDIKHQVKKPFEISEVQGMFFNCQSLQNINITFLDTHHVDNMTEMFFKCYNLRNIYVDATRWSIENTTAFTRMFSQCHSLRTNKGRKAVDVDQYDYGDFCVVGTDKVEGFLKDINTTYDDYGEHLERVPIDSINYISETPAPTITYEEEPEGDGGSGSGSGSGSGDASAKAGDGNISQSGSGNTSSNVGQTAQTETSALPPSVPETQNIAIETQTQEITQTIEPQMTDAEIADSEISMTDSDGRKIMEIGEYLREQGLEGAEGSGQGKSGILDDVKFLAFAIIVLSIVILLLVGMVIYLTKSNRENKKGDDQSI